MVFLNQLLADTAGAGGGQQAVQQKVHI